MPKSKQQKREEAIQRARVILPMHRDWWLRTRPGDDCQDKELSEKAEKAFIKAASAAKTDLHGNPL